MANVVVSCLVEKESCIRGSWEREGESPCVRERGGESVCERERERVRVCDREGESPCV